MATSLRFIHLVSVPCLVISLLLQPFAVLAQNSSSGASAIAKAYTPTIARCPSNFTLVRFAGAENASLASEETAYTSARRDHVLPAAWHAYLSTVQKASSSANVSLPSYVSSILSGNSSGSGLPTLGIATSGGGYRAALFGAGVLNALDARNASAAHAGTGGLLQAATYLAGLSGGAWLVTSFAQADFLPIPELINGPPGGPSTPNAWGGWNTDIDLIEPENSTTANLAFILGLFAEVSGKHAEGYPLTIADVWARLLARHFVNGTSASNFLDDSSTHGAGVLFSDIANVYVHSRLTTASYYF